MNLAPVVAQDGGGTPPRSPSERPESRQRFDTALWAALALPQVQFLLESSASFQWGAKSAGKGASHVGNDPDGEGNRATSDDVNGPTRDRHNDSRDAREVSGPSRSSGRAGASQRDETKVESLEKGRVLPQVRATSPSAGEAGHASEAETTAMHLARAQGRGQSAGARVGPLLAALTQSQLVQRLGGTRPPASPRKIPSPTHLVSKPPGAKTTLLVPFKEAHGQEGRIRLSLRGNALRATILTPNGETVRNLGSRISEIQRALGERGFAEAQVAVRHTRVPDASEVRSEAREDPTGHGGDRQSDSDRDGSDRGGSHSRSDSWKEDRSS
jgi:hypothetical protein